MVKAGCSRLVWWPQISTLFLWNLIRSSCCTWNSKIGFIPLCPSPLLPYTGSPLALGIKMFFFFPPPPPHTHILWLAAKIKTKPFPFRPSVQWSLTRWIIWVRVLTCGCRLSTSVMKAELSLPLNFHITDCTDRHLHTWSHFYLKSLLFILKAGKCQEGSKTVTFVVLKYLSTTHKWWNNGSCRHTGMSSVLLILEVSSRCRILWNLDKTSCWMEAM